MITWDRGSWRGVGLLLALTGLSGCSTRTIASDALVDLSSSETALPDAPLENPVTFLITNRGPGSAFLEGGYTASCETLFGLYHDTGASGERVIVPTVAYCRCTSCDSPSCLGLANWIQHWVELPESAAITFAWRPLTYSSAPGGCASTGSACLEAAPALAGRYEIRVGYSRVRPVCPAGESSVPDTYLTPPGVTLPPNAKTQPCAPGPSLFCFPMDRQATAPFDLSSAQVTVDLRD